MRRRQIWQALHAAEHATVTPLPLPEPPKPQPWKVTPVAAPSAAERASEPPKEFAPGICSKCGRYIGRGMHFHVRSCDGKP